MQKWIDSKKWLFISRETEIQNKEAMEKMLKILDKVWTMIILSTHFLVLFHLFNQLNNLIIYFFSL